MTAACDTDADVDVGEFVEADYEEGFIDLGVSGQGGLIWVLGLEMGDGEYLEAEDLGLGERERFAIYFYETFAGLGGGRIRLDVVERWW